VRDGVTRVFGQAYLVLDESKWVLVSVTSNLDIVGAVWVKNFMTRKLQLLLSALIGEARSSVSIAFQRVLLAELTWQRRRAHQVGIFLEHWQQWQSD
jgi:hypothetical protein